MAERNMSARAGLGLQVADLSTCQLVVLKADLTPKQWRRHLRAATDATPTTYGVLDLLYISWCAAVERL
jgi:hypothetical protein